MPHVQIEIDFLTHPKTLATEPLAQLLFLRGLVYSAIHLTDGFLPTNAIRQLAFDLEDYERNHDQDHAARGIIASTPDQVSQQSLVTQLVQAKRWHKTKGGYTIHDYLKYQMSKQQVMELIEKKRNAGQAGGQASAQARAQRTAQRKSNESSTDFQRLGNESSTDFNPTPTPTPNTMTKEEEKKSATHRLSDEEFLVRLKSSPAYKHCNVEQELAKMDTWLLANPGRQKTRKFIVRWLNKIEKPMAVGNGHVSNRPPPPPPKNDPIARGMWGRQYGDPRQYGYD